MKNFRTQPKYIATVLALFAMVGCTDLEVEELDSVLIENEGAFSGVPVEESLTSAYADLRGLGNQENTFALFEATTDELLIPTRGTDWGDNGVWRTLHQHNWDATHRDIVGAWNQLNRNVFRTNQILHPATAGKTPQQTAEAKFLRAYNMFMIMDLFGQVPYREADATLEENPIVYTSQEAFDFIIKDLTEALPDLPALGPEADNLRASKAAAHFLFAKLYLNKHIYTKTGTPAAADMQLVIDNVNAIQAAGYQLADDYFDIFAPTDDSETIFYTDAEYSNRIWGGLHYNQITQDQVVGGQTIGGNTSGGWNGFSTTAEFYALFEGDPNSNEPGSGQEERRGFVPTDGSDFGIGYGFLVGQQYSASGEALNDRAGRPLVFTKEFPGLVGNREYHGIRVIKYHPVNGAFGKGLILFRYADAHLMEAEALFRIGDVPAALAMINELRAMREAQPLSSLEEMDILDERGRELYIEGWRRNDQIRFGTFTDPWTLKPASDDYRLLFPIPAVAVASNPNLEQNPGYE